MKAPQSLKQLEARAKRAAREIEQIFADAEHWNRLHPEEPPIDPDPDGEMRRARFQMARSLAGARKRAGKRGGE